MTEVEIPFSPEMRDAILQGNKKCTSRYRQYGRIGDVFTVMGYPYRITNVINPVLKFVRDNLWKEEGFSSPLAFENFWIKLHPRKRYFPDQRVYTHFFEVVE